MHGVSAVLSAVPSRVLLVSDCEVCMDHHGPSAGTVTFSSDFTGDEIPVRMCTDCLRAVAEAMARQYNEAIATDNAEVAAMCEMLGIEFPVAST